jgi:hypothetical protein
MNLSTADLRNYRTEFHEATDTIYPHIKFWWYRTMLNFYPSFLCRVLAAILKMADILKILKTQNCPSNGDLSLCQILCLYHYPVRNCPISSIFDMWVDSVSGRFGRLHNR